MKDVILESRAKIRDHIFNNCLDSRSIRGIWRCWGSIMDRSCAARHRGGFYHFFIFEWKTRTARGLI
jgi:hypothetical protein